MKPFDSAGIAPARKNALRNVHWILIPAIATAVALLFIAQSYVIQTATQQEFQWKNQFIRNLTFWYLWAALFPLIRELAIRFRFERGRRLRSALVHTLVGIIVAFAHTIISLSISEWFTRPESSVEGIAKIIGSSLISAMTWRFTLYQVILSVCLALEYYRRVRDLELQSSQIENRILRTQMESITMQIEPEFLFNNLQQLSKQMHKNLDSADYMLSRLGDYLRMTLDNSSNTEVNLRDEIEFLKCYVEIENFRAGTNHKIQTEIDFQVNDCEVPNLILQAPVEDAIRRRGKNPGDTSAILIIARKLDSKLVLSIIDNTNAVIFHRTTRVGALLERVNRIYLEPIEFKSINEHSQFHCTLEIPFPLQKRGNAAAENTATEEPEVATQNHRFGRTAKGWLITAGVWFAVSSYFAVQNIVNQASRGTPVNWPDLVTNFVAWNLWTLFTPFIMNVATQFPLRRGSFLKNGAVHLGVMLFTLIFASLIYATLKYYFTPIGDQGFAKSFPLLFGSPFPIDIVCYWTIVAITTAINNFRRFEFGKVKAVRLSAQLARARLQTLKMQLHPHFLFNTLNSISELMQEDPAAAEEMIGHLEKFLRLTLTSPDAQQISFEKELELLQCYLAIERVRFQDRLTINMEIEPQALNVSVPNLVLQPIVENAIKHGIASRSTQGQIDIRAKRNNGMLKVSIRDNGPGLNETLRESIEPFRSGLGLTNTRERLAQMYGKKHRFELHNAREGGLIVTFEIPAEIPFTFAYSEKVS